MSRGKDFIAQAVLGTSPEYLHSTDPERLFIQFCMDWIKKFLDANKRQLDKMEPIALVRLWEEGGGLTTDPLCANITDISNVLAEDFGSFRGGELVVMPITARRCSVQKWNITTITDAVDKLKTAGLGHRTIILLEPRLGRCFVHIAGEDLDAITDNVFAIGEWLKKGKELTKELIDESLTDIYQQHIRYPGWHMKKHVWVNPKTQTMVPKPEEGIQQILILCLVLIRTLFKAQIRPEDNTAAGRIDISITVPRANSQLEIYLLELKVVKPDASITEAEKKIRLGMHQAKLYREDHKECKTTFSCNYIACSSVLNDAQLQSDAVADNVELRMYPLSSKTASAG